MNHLVKQDGKSIQTALNDFRKEIAKENDRSVLRNIARSIQLLVNQEHRHTARELNRASAVNLRYHIMDCFIFWYSTLTEGK